MSVCVVVVLWFVDRGHATTKNKRARGALWVPQMCNFVMQNGNLCIGVCCCLFKQEGSYGALCATDTHYLQCKVEMYVSVCVVVVLRFVDRGQITRGLAEHSMCPNCIILHHKSV